MQPHWVGIITVLCGSIPVFPFLPENFGYFHHTDMSFLCHHSLDVLPNDLPFVSMKNPGQSSKCHPSLSCFSRPSNPSFSPVPIGFSSIFQLHEPSNSTISSKRSACSARRAMKTHSSRVPDIAVDRNRRRIDADRWAETEEALGFLGIWGEII